jgi:hypothetical protein
MTNPHQTDIALRAIAAYKSICERVDASNIAMQVLADDPDRNAKEKRILGLKEFSHQLSLFLESFAIDVQCMEAQIDELHDMANGENYLHFLTTLECGLMSYILKLRENLLTMGFDSAEEAQKAVDGLIFRRSPVSSPKQ